VKAPATLTAVSYPASEWPAFAGVWAELASASPYSSFFTSAEWTGAWLSVYASSLNVSIVIFQQADRPVGICLLTRRTEKRGPVAVKRIYLNTAGEDEEDEACIEFNNLLCLDGYEEAVARALQDQLALESWDELVLTGFTPGAMLDCLQRMFSATTQKVEARASAFVDLAALRTAGKRYDTVVSSRNRTYIRQNVRMYSETGEIRLEKAADASEALSMLDELAVLHQKAWTTRGRKGAFSSDRFFAFHRLLIARSHERGLVQLFRLAAGSHTIGLLQNFVWNGKIYFYQSGFQYQEDGRYKPGLMTFAYTIQHYLDAGYDNFDFLAGESQYKRMLTNGTGTLSWVVFQQSNFKMKAVEFLSQSRRSIRSLASARAE
jgi:CelD/BcsL family acetyltransferase involved in cellulose biosynthesis